MTSEERANAARLVPSMLDPRRKFLLGELAKHSTDPPSAWIISPRIDRQSWREGEDKGEELLVLELTPATPTAPPEWRLLRSRVSSRRERGSELCRFDDMAILSSILAPVSSSDAERQMEAAKKKCLEWQGEAEARKAEADYWRELCNKTAAEVARLSEIVESGGNKGGRPRRELADEETRRILDLRAGGWTINKIAEHLHISNRVIMRAIKEAKK